TEGLGLLAPERQQRPHDAVLALGPDPRRPPARDEAVEDRLDLVARRVAGGARALGPERVADLPQAGLVAAARGGLHDLGPETVGAEARVLVGFGAAESVVDMQRRDAIPELAEDVEEAGRVG